jgi:hypothetical protein
MIMFWKAEVENKSTQPRNLKSVVIQQEGSRIIVRFTLDDDNFFDVDGAMPRFDRGETVNIALHHPLCMPTTETEASVAGEE